MYIYYIYIYEGVRYKMPDLTSPRPGKQHKQTNKQVVTRNSTLTHLEQCSDLKKMYQKSTQGTHKQSEHIHIRSNRSKSLSKKITINS